MLLLLLRKRLRLERLLVGVVGTLEGAATTNTAGTAGGDQANLLAGGAVAGDGGGVANVLMVTTTMGMLNGVTGHTTNLGPAVALTAEAEEGVTGLQDGLLNTSATSDDADDATAGGAELLGVAGGQLDVGVAELGLVGHHDAVVARGAGEGSTISGLLLDAAHDATLGDATNGEDVADGQGGVLTAHDGLSGEQTLGGDEQLLDALVLVGVAELDTSEGGTTAGLVLDGLHGTANVAVTLRVVANAEASGAKALVAVQLVHGTGTLTLSEDDLTHLVLSLFRRGLAGMRDTHNWFDTTVV